MNLRELGRGGLTKLGLTAALLAAAVNAAIFAIGRAAGSDFFVPARAAAEPGRFVGVGEVVFVSIVTVALGAVVLGLAVRRSTKAARAVLVIAVVFAVLSAGGPVSMVGLPSGAFLASMHLVTAAIFVGIFGRALRERDSVTKVPESATVDTELLSA